MGRGTPAGIWEKKSLGVIIEGGVARLLASGKRRVWGLSLKGAWLACWHLHWEKESGGYHQRGVAGLLTSALGKRVWGLSMKGAWRACWPAGIHTGKRRVWVLSVKGAWQACWHLHWEKKSLGVIIEGGVARLLASTLGKEESGCYHRRGRGKPAGIWEKKSLGVIIEGGVASLLASTLGKEESGCYHRRGRGTPAGICTGKRRVWVLSSKGAWQACWHLHWEKKSLGVIIEGGVARLLASALGKEESGCYHQKGRGKPAGICTGKRSLGVINEGGMARPAGICTGKRRRLVFIIERGMASLLASTLRKEGSEGYHLKGGGTPTGLLASTLGKGVC